MNDELWDDRNERLALLADLSTNMGQRLTEELAKVERAASSVNQVLRGHFIKVEPTYSRTIPKFWECLDVKLIRADDSYEFPNWLQIWVDDFGLMTWSKPSNPDEDVKFLLTKLREDHWTNIIGQMVESNLKRRGA